MIWQLLMLYNALDMLTTIRIRSFLADVRIPSIALIFGIIILNSATRLITILVIIQLSFKDLAPY